MCAHLPNDLSTNDFKRRKFSNPRNIQIPEKGKRGENVESAICRSLNREANISPIKTLKMPAGARVFLGNVASSVRERDIEKFFKSYGRLRDVVIKNGFGFAEFDDDR